MMSVFNQSGGDADTGEETACFYGTSAAGVQPLHGSPKLTLTAATNYETPTTPLIHLAPPKTLTTAL